MVAATAPAVMIKITKSSSYGRILFIAAAMALLSGALSAPLQEPSLQEVLAYLNSLHIPQSQEVGGANKARELYEAILRRGGGDDIEDEAIQAKIMEILQAHQSDKRANYMSLCHFKICNMGRKRTLWPRN